MAGKRKSSGRKVRFELTYSGIAGIGIVCFCVFLWMFLLGVWVGQSMLLPAAGSRAVTAGGDAVDAPSPDIKPMEAEGVKKSKKGQ